jgi:hypothetical protein
LAAKACWWTRRAFKHSKKPSLKSFPNMWMNFKSKEASWHYKSKNEKR